MLKWKVGWDSEAHSGFSCLELQIKPRNGPFLA
jgi:hypothetical protein